MGKIKQKIHSYYELIPKDKRKAYLVAATLFAVLFLIMFMFFSNHFAKRASTIKNTYVSPFIYIFSLKTYIYSILLAGGLTFLLILLFYKSNDFRNSIKEEDKDRNINIADKSTSGSSRYMMLSEVEEVYEVVPIGKTKATTFGKLRKEMDKSGRLVAFKPKPYQSDGSGLQNTLIIGHSGSGKSYSFVRNEIINSIDRGHSVVVSDPSGELYTDLSSWCKSLGVDVKALNLADLGHSDGWNCLKECIDPKTKRLDGSRLNAFVSIYLENTPSGKAESFWQGQTVSYLKAAISYLFWMRELHILKSYKYLYKMITNGRGDYRVNKNLFSDDASFVFCERLIRNAAIENGFNLDEVNKAIELADETAPECSIGLLKNVFDDFDKVGKFFTNRTFPANDVGKSAYDIIKKGLTSESIAVSAITGVMNELSLLTDKKLSYVLSRDGITSSNLNKKQSIYFLCMDTQSDELKPIASLFMSFLLKNAEEQYNHEAAIAKENGVKPNLVDTTVMLDEFYSLGKIGGSTDWFSKYIANSRKAHMHTNIILQNITQLPAVYGDSLADTIISNCEFIAVLGANDPVTCEFVSSFVCGETTVIDENHTVNIGPINRSTSNEVTMTSKSRRLMTPDEVRRFKDGVLLVKHGEFPLILDYFPYNEHPIYEAGLLKPVSISSSILSFEEKIAMEFENNKTLNGMDFINYVNGLGHQVVDPKTGEVEIIINKMELTKEFKSLTTGKYTDEEKQVTVEVEEAAKPEITNNTSSKVTNRRSADNLIEVAEGNNSILNDE